MAGCGGQDLPVWASLPLSPTTHIHASAVFLINGGDQEAGGVAALSARLQALLKPPPPASLFRSSSSTTSLRGVAAAQARRPNARWALLAALLLVGLMGFVDVQGGLQRALLRARGGIPVPPVSLDFPVQSCCIGEQCVRNSRGRHAVVTHVHSQREVTQLQRLEASVRATNPGVDVAVMLVRGELGAAATQRLLASKVTIFYVEPLRDPWGAKAR